MRLLALLGLMVFAGPALAEPVIARSGEHADFSRIVLEFSQPPNWRMGKSDDQYILELNASYEIDLSKILDRLPRGRISSVTYDAEQSRVVLTPDCPCYADAFIHRDNRLVIDIIDGPAPTDAGFEIALTGTDAAAAREHEPGTASFPALGITGAAHFLSERARSYMATGTELIDDHLSKMGERNSASHTVMRDNAIRHIAQAVAQGALEANPSAFKDDVRQSPTEVLSHQEYDISQHLDVSADVYRSSSNPGNQNLDHDASCISPEWLDVAEWGDEADIWSGIAPSRSGLYGEFDDLDPEKALELAQAYVFASFGAEAIAVLDLLPNPPQDSVVLRDLAKILDANSVYDSHLVSQVQCDGPTAMWAVLSAPVQEQSELINRPAVISTFSALPMHLRKILGPPLIQRFLELDDLTTAGSIRDAVVRAGGEEPDNLRLAEADMAVKQGRTSQAVEMLDTVAASGQIETAMAIPRLIDLQIQTEDNVDQQVLETARAFAFEYSNSAEEVTLKLAEIRGLAHNQQFERMLEDLSELNEKNSLSEQSAIIDGIIGDFVSVSNDVTFLRLMVAYQTSDVTNFVSVPTRRRIADRLLRLGFPELADHWLPLDARAEDQILKARIHMTEGEPSLALAELDHLTGPEVNELLIEAYRQLGSFREMAELAQQTGQEDLVSEAHWLARKWSALGEESGSRYLFAAETMASKDSFDSSGEPDLEKLLERARERSATTADVIAETTKFMSQFPPS